MEDQEWAAFDQRTMIGEPTDKELRDLLDDKVHLLIRINLLENSRAKNVELARILARHLDALDDQISERRSAISLGWQVRNLPKINLM